MSMERSRRDRLNSHSIPLTWDLPLLMGMVVVALVSMTPLVVQGFVCFVVAGDFVWPTGEWPTALLGLAHGHFAVGLPAGVAGALPAHEVLWAATAVAEIAALCGVAVVASRVRELLGMGTRRGLATRAQARDALGVAVLRRKAAVVRPDLHASWHPRLGRTRR